MSFLLYQLPLASQLTKCQAIGAAFRTRRIRAPSLANFLPSRPALDLPAPASSLCSNTQAGHPPESLLLALHRPGVPASYVATWHVASFPPPLRSRAPRSEKPLIKHRLRSTLHPRGSRVSALLLSPALVTPCRVINLSVPRLPVFSPGM